MSAADVVVVDNGSGFIKAGYAADNLPRHIFPSIVGRPMLRAEEEAIGDVELKDVMVGDEAAALRRALEISHPVESGVVKSWDDMERVWGHLFADRMGLDTVKFHPSASTLGSGSARGSSAVNGAGGVGHPTASARAAGVPSSGGHAKDKRVLLTEAPQNPRENRRRMVESMFETFGFGGVKIEVQAMLTLYAQGLMSGLVLDSGDGVTHAVAVFDGYCPPHLTRRLDVAGRHITRYLSKLLLLRGYAFNGASDLHSVQEMKDALCYVALDPSKDRLLAEETTALVERYTLPDGRVVKLGRERFEAPEALFNPSLIDVEGAGLSDMAFDLIQAADIDIRASLYGQVVLSGGTTMFPGLPSRLERDLRERYLRDILKGDKSRVGKMRVHVEDPPRRRHAVFLGASVLGDIMKDRADFWWSREEYQEHGAARLMDLKEGRLKA